MDFIHTIGQFRSLCIGLFDATLSSHRPGDWRRFVGAGRALFVYRREISYLSYLIYPQSGFPDCVDDCADLSFISDFCFEVRLFCSLYEVADIINILCGTL